MELFRGRPMAVTGILTIAAAAAGFYCALNVKYCLIIAVLPAVLTVSLLLAFRKITVYRFLAVFITLVAICGVLLRSTYCYDRAFYAASRYAGEERRITGTVEERTFSSDYLTIYSICLTSVGGEVCDMPATLECRYTSDLQVYDTFSMTADICLVTEGEEKYIKSAVSEGRFLNIVSEDETQYDITGEHRQPLPAFIRDLNRRLSGIIGPALGGDEGALVSAMLLGNRELVSDAVSSDFARSGLSHLLAVSGLHLSVICGAAGWILSRLRLPRTLRTICLSAFVLVYLTLIGFPYSAVRSAVMLIIVFISYFAGFGTDGVNSLGLAATLILVADPAALLDAGFILSFSATLGLVIFLPYCQGVLRDIRARRDARRRAETAVPDKSGKTGSADKTGEMGSDNKTVETGTDEKRQARSGNRRTAVINALRRVHDYTAFAVLTVLSASLTISVSVWLIFGEISLGTALTNLFISPCSLLLLILGALYLPLSAVPFVSEALVFYLRRIAAFMIASADGVSDMRGVVMSLRYDFVPYILIPFAALTLILLVIRLKRRWLVFVPAVVAVLAFAVCFTVNISRPSEPECVVLSDGADEVMLIQNGSLFYLCDIGDGSYTMLAEAYETARENGATELEALILTHYHVRHELTVKRLLSREKVRCLWLPYPAVPEDTEIMKKLCMAAEAAGCSCFIIPPDGKMSISGDLTLTVPPPRRIERSTHPCILFGLEYKEKKLSYIGESAWELYPGAETGIADAGILLFGSHGPVAKTYSELAVKPEAEIVSFDGSLLPYIVGCGNGVRDAAIKENVSADVNIWRYSFEE